MGQQEFETPQAALAHYGVKGMKWGVRKEDESGGSGSKSKPVESSADDLAKVMDEFYSKKTPGQLESEGKAKLAEQAASEFPKKISESRARKADKADAAVERLDERISELQNERAETKPGLIGGIKRRGIDNSINTLSDIRDDQARRSEQLRSGKLTTEQKKAFVAVGLTAAAVGVAAYGNYKVKELHKTNYEENRRETSEQWNALFGRDFPGPQAGAVGHGGGSFYAGLTNKKALTRPEFTIPAGTKFQRLSDHEEDTSEYGKVKGAYATFLKNDKKIYGASGEFGGKKYTVEFEADGPVRVPNLTTVLAHMKQVKKAEYPDVPNLWSDDAIYAQYHKMAGGSWSSPDAKKLFDSLKLYGYSAIVDDMDAGYLGDLPVVFFGNAKPGVSKERTAVDRGNDKAGIAKLAREYA